MSTCSILPLRIILLKQQAMEQQINDMGKELKESKARIQQLEATVLILKQGHHQQTSKVNEATLNRFQPGLGTALHTNTIGNLALKKTPNFQECVFEALAEALHSNSSLQHLKLRDCDFLSHQGNRLGEALRVNSGLTTLYITSCQLGDQGAQAIATALHTNSTLQSLDLQVNEIGDQGAQVLAEALCANSSMQLLNIVDNKIEDFGSKHLEECRGAQSGCEWLIKEKQCVLFTPLELKAVAAGLRVPGICIDQICAMNFGGSKKMVCAV